MGLPISPISLQSSGAKEQQVAAATTQQLSEKFSASLASAKNAANDNKTASEDIPVTTAASKEGLETLFRSMAGCADEGPCNEKIGAAKIAKWIQYSKFRTPERKGFEELDFSDFQNLNRKFKNALAKKLTTPEIRGHVKSYSYWVMNEDDSLDPDVTIDKVLVAETTYPVILTDSTVEGDYSFLRRLPTKIPALKVAAKLVELMGGDGDKEGVTERQFVSFMLNKQN